jgi:nucleoside phosphorylase
MDPVLDRILFEARPAPLTPIPWPAGLAPTNHGAPTPTEIPKADVLVVTWTAAEAQALADVLTPGHPSSAWSKYTDGWDQIEKELTGRSPARESKCLAVWAVTTIAGKTVVLVKSDLHLSTDAVSLPVKRLWEQLIAAVRPELVITTGTAGGIGAHMALGDVLIADAAKFNCIKAFKDEPWAQTRFESDTSYVVGEHVTEAQNLLMPVNAGRLQPIATRLPEVVTGDVETVDYFGFDDPTDSYGIVKDDAKARMEEMDDATLPLAIRDIEEHYGNVEVDGKREQVRPPRWLAIRNASDPMVPTLGDLEAEKKWAAAVYAKYGYWTTIGSAIACWAVIADL